MTLLDNFWRSIFGGHRASREIPPAKLPGPDPDIQKLHDWQHRIINDFQKAQLKQDTWSQRQRSAWHPETHQNQ